MSLGLCSGLEREGGETKVANATGKDSQRGERGTKRPKQGAGEVGAGEDTPGPMGVVVSGSQVAPETSFLRMVR